MGEGTRKFADEAGEIDLYELILREDFFYDPSKLLRSLDDQDPEVIGLFRSARRRLARAVSNAPEGSAERNEAERLLAVFRKACHKAGFDKVNGADKEKSASGSAMEGITGEDIDDLLKGFVEEGEMPSKVTDEGLRGGFTEDAPSLEALASSFNRAITPSGEYRSVGHGGQRAAVNSNGAERARGKLTLEIERTPGLTEQMRGQIVMLGPTFRRAVEGGDKTMHVGSPGFHGFPESISVGEKLIFSFGDKEAPREVKVIRVEEYSSIAQLTDNESLVGLKKMFLGESKIEIMGNMKKLFREERVREKGLILFEFELIN